MLQAHRASFPCLAHLEDFCQPSIILNRESEGDYPQLSSRMSRENYNDLAFIINSLPLINIPEKLLDLMTLPILQKETDTKIFKR